MPHKPFVIPGAARDLLLPLSLLLLLFTPHAKSQGCAQCRDALTQTPARTQQAYRRAITLMVLAGTTVFTAAFLTLKRYR